MGGNETRGACAPSTARPAGRPPHSAQPLDGVPMAASCRHSHVSFCFLLLLLAAAAAHALGAAGSSSHVQLSAESLLPAAGSSCLTPKGFSFTTGSFSVRDWCV